ncbi:MAG: response regulator [Ahrensia sp.]|nr:response regulator [Ahrensia sp.]
MQTTTFASERIITDDAKHILVVDDDTRIRELLTEYLIRNDYRVTAAENAADARRKMVGLEFDLLILDVMMPGEDGISFAKSMRAQNRDVPILMLTARSDTEHRIEGLSAGADDYLPKPFDPRELLLRVSNIVKRAVPTNLLAVEQVSFGPFTFVFSKRELKKNGETVRLTDRERDIMLQLTQAPNDTVPRQELVTSPNDIGERTIDVQINRLRRKIETDPTNPRYLQTVRGIGYRLSTE